MRIGLFVGVLMVPAVDRNPAGRRILQAAEAEHGEEMLEAFRALESAMRQEPVITKIDAEDAEDEIAGNQQRDTGPTEKPGKEREQGAKVITADQE
jgi:hypothetical protein